FRREHPLTGIRLEAGNRDRVRSLLDRHQVDLVISGRPEPGWDVAVLAVRPHDLVVVAAPDLAVGAARAAGPDGPGGADGLLTWLARQTWLLREPGSGTRASTAALLAEMDIAPLALMVGSNGAIRESARVGLGVTLVSRDAVAAELAAGQLAEIPVKGTPLHRDWYLLARREELPHPASRLVDHVLHTGAFRRALCIAGGHLPSTDGRPADDPAGDDGDHRPGGHRRQVHQATGWPDRVASGQGGWFQLVHGDADDQALAVQQE